MERNLSRRDFLAACITAVSIGVLSIAWDSVINDGHPAQTDESPNDDGEEPP